jgi:hypothetical protein
MGTHNIFHFFNMMSDNHTDVHHRTLYLLFAAFPIVFQLHRGWSEGIGGLAFLGKSLIHVRSNKY